MKRSTLAVAALALTVVGASTARAQSAMASPVHFGLSAGGTIPTGDLSDSHNSGFHINGLLEFRGATSPLALRAEVGYHGLAGKSVSFTDPNLGTFSAKAENLSMITGTANGVYGFPVAAAATVRPYLIAGAGVYSFKSGGEVTGDLGNFSASARLTKFGGNGGIGPTFQRSGFNTFAEVRYHYLFSKNDNDGTPNLQLIPISFGIMF